MFVYAFVKPIVCIRLNNKIIIIIIIIVGQWASPMKIRFGVLV
jgi:hypothetical protein